MARRGSASNPVVHKTFESLNHGLDTTRGTWHDLTDEGRERLIRVTHEVKEEYRERINVEIARRMKVLEG